MIQTSQTYGPWAVVTGASSGIGLGFAHHLAATGINLVLAARSTDRLHDLGTTLARDHGIDHRVVTVDLARPGAAATVADAISDLDVGLVVSNAGAGRPAPFLERDLAELHRSLTLNAVSHVELVHHLAPRLAARDRAGIVLVGAAMHGIPYMAPDSSAKGYVLNLGEALHLELAPHGVDVTVLLPGAIDTPVIDALGLQRDRLPVRPQSVEDAVRQTMRGLERGRTRVQGGGTAMRVAAALTPRSLSIRFNGRMLGEAAQRLAARTEAPAVP